MKRKPLHPFVVHLTKPLFAAFIVLFTSIFSYGQLATYPFMSGSSNPTPGTASAAGTSPNVTAGTHIILSSMENSGPYNSQGYRVKTLSTAWPGGPNDTYGFDIPLSPKAGYDFKLTGITANINNISFKSTSGPLQIDVYYQVDGVGTWRKVNGSTSATISTSTTTINFGAISDNFYNGHTYAFRFYVYASGATDKSDNFRLNTLVFNGSVTAPPAVAPIVTTGTPGAVTKYSASVPSTYSFGATYRVAYQSGVVWSINTNPTVLLSTKTNNGAAGTIPGNITGLTPGTTYYVKAYAITQVDTVYGAEKTFVTLPPSVPSIVTNPVTSILSNKATSGGNSIDSGGYKVIEKGICWSLAPNPTTTNFKNIEGTGNASFVSVMKNLTPSTTYYVRAYAKNSLGTGYGNEYSFTTTTAVPTITAIPGTIDFGNVSYNANPPVSSYILSAAHLTPGGGTITVTPPTTGPYQISTSASSGFTSSPISIPYGGDSLANTRIYVKMSTATYGTYNNYYITHSGGGVVVPNADTVAINGSIVQDPTVLTNMGTDFWFGHGLEENMDKAGAYGLLLYVATGAQGATIKVSIPGIPSFTPLTYTIPANSVKIVSGFPTGGAGGDCRLYYTGVTSNAIHLEVTNNVPVAAFIYDYATNNSAGGSMIFPSNTWNSSYIVQSYGGAPSNTGVPSSYFFVIANDDNTVVTFKPTNAIIDSASSPLIAASPGTGGTIKYPANTTSGYQVTLNKGQIFNALGYVDPGGISNNGTSRDLTGTVVSTNCDKKIAVFGGNSRTLINTSSCSPTSGSDNLIQQMFPKVAWGTYYLTVPTKTMEYNLFRIGVQDPTTIVKVDGSVLPMTTPTWNATGLYYQIEGNKMRKIESDKPITVTQFILPGSACGGASVGNNGTGDPEMILLSPVQQAINNTTVYTSDFKDGSSGGTYINVLIPQSGVSSFKLDPATNPTQMVDTGTSSYGGSPYGSAALIPIANAFKPHPQDPNYYWAKFHVSYPATHVLTSNVGFNAIAYGVANGESWGYNAGTAIKNLSAIAVAQNPYGNDTSTTAIRTCKNNPVKLQIALPYNPYTVDKIIWTTDVNPIITPSGDTVTGSQDPDPGNPSHMYAHYDGTTVVDGRTFYLYTSPGFYSFSEEGTFEVKATAVGTFVSDCGGTNENKIKIIVGHDNISFLAVPAACGDTKVTFTDQTQPMPGTTIKEWRWDFGDTQTYNTTNTANPNPVPNPHAYPPVSSGVTSYWAKLTTINSTGCFSVDSVLIDFSFNLKAKFKASKDTICPGETVVFTDQSSSTAVQWIWDWADGHKDTVNATSPAPAISHQFTTDGTYNVKLLVKNSGGCQSPVVDTNIVVKPKPVPVIAPIGGVCQPGNTAFHSNTTISDGTISDVKYLWHFGDGFSGTGKDTIHSYTGTPPFTVWLIATSKYGCVDSISTSVTDVFAKPTAAFTGPSSICARDTATFTDASTATGQTINHWSWVFGDGNTSNVQNPSQPYNTPGTYQVKLVVETNKGCVSDTSAPLSITIKPTPVITFSTIASLCLNASPVTITQPAVSAGMSGGTFTYSGTGVSGNTFDPATSGGAGVHPIYATYVAPNGCKDADTTNITVWALPVGDFTYSTNTCEQTAITFTDKSTPVGSFKSWKWDFDDAGATANTQNSSHTYLTAGSHNVTLIVTDTNGCKNLTPVTKTVTVHNKPYAAFTLPASVCLPDGLATFTNTSTVADDASPSYAWNFGEPSSTSNTSLLPSPSHNYASSGPFNVNLLVTSKYGCIKDTTITLGSSIIHAQPLANASALPPEACLGEPIVFSGSTNGADVSWHWTMDDGNTDPHKDPSYTYTIPGTFNVTFYYIDNNGCKSNVVPTQVTVHPLPVVDAGPTQFVLEHESVTLKATASGTGLHFKWTPATFLNYDTLLNPVCTPSAEQLYTLVVTGTGGCTAKDTTRIVIFKEPKIPNAFSPNGDGINDTWDIPNLNTYTGCTVEIFNRYGQKVFSNTGYDIPWNGTSNGKPVPVGVYYYVIDPKHNHKLITGNVTILR